MYRFKWYRKLRGGHWIYYINSGWHKVSKFTYQVEVCYRMSSPEWSFENYTDLPKPVSQ